MTATGATAQPAVGASRMRRVLRVIRRIVIGLIALIVLVLVVGSAYQLVVGNVPDGRYAVPWRLVDIGGRLLHVNCMGQGTPTVILEAGLGSGAVTWQHVQRPISELTRVCSYDRAGYGWSTSGPSPRTSARVTDDLHRLLEKAGVQGPLVLAGHSLGGLFARHYAATYPTEIAGMILVDSTHEDQDKPPAPLRVVLKILTHSGVPRLFVGFGDPALDAMYQSNRTLAAIDGEFAGLEESSNQTRDARFSFGSKPLIVLTSGSNDEDPDWQRLQKELATRSSNGKRIVATGSGHYIQDDRPELVIDAVREVVAQSRAQPGQSAARPNIVPDEAAGLDGIVRALITAFDQVDVVALGDDHGEKLDSDVRIALVRHPDFAKKVRFIVVEFASTAQQATLDRYIQGEDVPIAELERVWMTTTDRFGVWKSPVYPRFLAAVRDVNQKLPADARIRVLAGDPPAGSSPTTRDPTAVSVLKKQVLEKHGKALVIYGAAHFYRKEVNQILLTNGGGITTLLEAEYPGRTLVVMTVGGPGPEFQKFDRALKTAVRPVLVSLQRSPFKDFTAEEFIGQKMLNCRGPNGCVSAFQGSDVTLGQLADACVFWRATK